MRKIVLSLLAFVCLAASVQAAEPFVVLVDEERGLLLIPEGTAVPKGVEFTMGADDLEPRTAMSVDGAAEPAGAPRRFVYAYAAPEKFVEPRKRIAEAEAKMSQDMKADDLGPLAVADGEQILYFYFWDDSYHYMRKYITHQSSNNWVQYSVHSKVVAAAGDWDTKAYINQYSAQYSYWNSTDTCWFYGAAGTCYGSAVTLVTPDENLTATVTSTVSLTRFLYPPCDYPCKRNSSNTLSISFP